ncbi:MAG: hypothetical protein U0746_07445 [Gemmataceae bacterium]
MRIARTVPRRSGAVALWALVVLSLLGAVSATTAWHWVATRRTLDKRCYELQANWLARAGGELAVARLLAGADSYTGETIAIIPESELRIAVRKDGDKYRVRCEVRYPLDYPRPITKALTWTAIRRSDPSSVTLELTEPE